MINLILFGSFFVMLLLNIPIAVSLGMSSIFALLFSSSPLTVVPTNVYSGMAKFLLLAIPFFVLSGNIMAKAGISSRLVAFADDCVGHRRGGIAIVAVIVACFFGAISGSGPATVAALGIILIPAMINRGGFSAPFASSLMASASSIAIVIPPSIAFKEAKQLKSFLHCSWRSPWLWPWWPAAVAMTLPAIPLPTAAMMLPLPLASSRK